MTNQMGLVLPIDREVTRIQIPDGSLCLWVEFRCEDDDLVGRV